jgi:predicted AlkP superfamily pyrophosphatase or phosphodiesterase
MSLASRLSIAPLALAAALAVPAPVLAEEAPLAEVAATQGRPRLIVAIAVDQYSADLFAQYRDRYSRGLARLQTGAVFPSGFQSHAATETCPGHSTLLTGVHPSRTGIIANSWFVPGIGREDKEVYCAEDETNPKSTSDDPVVSPGHLKVPTLGDMLKKANPAALNVAVSAKDRAVVMMSGHTADAAYWFKGKGFATYADRKLSPAAKAENAALADMVAKGAGELPMPSWCAPFDRTTKVGDFTIGTYRFPLSVGDFKDFNRSPRMDAATADMAIRLLDELPLGKDDVTDVLSVSFSATDYVGHAYGHEGVEMCIQMDQLDRTVGTLLDALDARGIDYLVVLTADHGGLDAPERLREQGVPYAGRVDASLTSKALSEAVSKDTGISAKSGPLLYGAGGSGDIWIAAGLTDEQKKKVVSALMARLKANPQVEAAYTAGELAKVKVPSGNPQDWTMIERVAGSYNPAHSGDVLMMTRRALIPGTPRPGYTTTHGSPWDYDRRVPLLFWRKGMTPMEQVQPVETVDIAPTLAARIGLAEPAGTWDGRCLDIDAGEADSCSR